MSIFFSRKIVKMFTINHILHEFWFFVKLFLSEKNRENSQIHAKNCQNWFYFSKCGVFCQGYFAEKKTLLLP